MANQPEIIQYDTGVYQLEVADPVQGGVGGIANASLLNLANRTAYLKKHVDDLEAGNTIPPTLAPINSPALTGTPTAPTAPLGDNSTKIANTAFVQGTVNGIATINVAGNSNVSLTAVQAGAGILVLTGALTGNIAVIVPSSAKSWIVSNQTSGAFSLTVKTAAGTGVVVAQGKNAELWCDATNVNQSTNDYTNAALTGTPTAPTAPSGDNSTTVANTGFVFNATDGLSTISVAGSSDVTLTQAQYGSAILNLTGALTANINLKFPQQSGHWIISNSSTGSFTITAKTTAASGATTVLPQGSAVIVYSDGTNMYFASAGGQSSFTLSQFAPAAGTTILTVTTGYTVGNIFVEKNGAWLEPSDYTATDGATIVLNTATVAGDVINVYAFKTFTIANAVQKTGDTMTGPLILSGNATNPLGSVPLQQTVPAPGFFSNLALSASGTNAIVNVSYAALALFDGAGNYLLDTAVSDTINTATTGAGGLDAGTLAASTWYSVWRIAQPGGTKSWLISLSATAPTMPSGYTLKARIGWIRTDGTANKYPFGFTQFGKSVRYKIAAGSNLTAPRQMAVGVQGNVSTPTWVAVACGNFVPSTAAKIAVLPAQSVGSGVVVIVAPNNASGGYTTTANPPPAASGTGTSGNSFSITEFNIESANIYYAGNDAGCAVYCVGWEDNL